MPSKANLCNAFMRDTRPRFPSYSHSLMCIYIHICDRPNQLPCVLTDSMKENLSPCYKVTPIFALVQFSLMERGQFNFIQQFSQIYLISTGWDDGKRVFPSCVLIVLIIFSRCNAIGGTFGVLDARPKCTFDVSVRNTPRLLIKNER